MDGRLEEDGCRTRREFIEKALRSAWAVWPRRAPRTTSPGGLVDALQGIVEHHRPPARPPLQIERGAGHGGPHHRLPLWRGRGGPPGLRATAVDEAKRTNGRGCFDAALNTYKARKEDDGWLGWRQMTNSSDIQRPSRSPQRWPSQRGALRWER